MVIHLLYITATSKHLPDCYIFSASVNYYGFFFASSGHMEPGTSLGLVFRIKIA